MTTASPSARASRPGRKADPARRSRHCCEALEERLLLNAGDPDPSFSGDGEAWVDYPFPSSMVAVYDVAVQPDGKIVLAGQEGSRGMVARLNVNGTMDRSFGGDGFVGISSSLRARGVAIQGDGKIVLCGTGERDDTNTFGVARLLPDGSPDSAFGDRGTALTDFGDYSSSAEDLAIQRDGKIVVAGSRTDVDFLQDPEHDFAVARYNLDGTLDDTFDFDGKVGIGFGHDDETAQAIAIDYNGAPQSNPYYGTIVVSGGGPEDDNSAFYVARLSPAGKLDTRFDDDGKLSTRFPGAASANSTGVVIQAGGRIVATGVVGPTAMYRSGAQDFALVRYLANGDLDPSFGIGGTGQVRTDFGFNDVAYDVVVNHMGGLTLAGTRVAAYTSDGRLDNRFGGDGEVRAPSGSVRTIAVAPARRLVVAGFDVARYMDVAPVVGFLSFDTTAHEAGRETAAFLVVRDEAAATPLRVYLSVGGTATPPGAVRNPDYAGFAPASALFPQGGYVDIPAGQTFATVVITPVDDALVEGDETAVFTFRTDDAYDPGPRPSLTLTLRDDDAPAPARVTQVFLNGPRLTGGTTANAAAFRALAGIDAVYGYAVPAAANQLKSIPWVGGVNQVALRFDTDMASALDRDDLAVRGVNRAAATFAGFRYDPLTKTAVWTLAAAIVNDKVRLVLDDALVPKLDGEWANASDAESYPSGNGLAGGDFDFRINVLVGDATGDGVINTPDVWFVRGRAGRTATSPGTGRTAYSPFGDLNADGASNFLDLGLVRERLNRRLPASEPAATAILGSG